MDGTEATDGTVDAVQLEVATEELRVAYEELAAQQHEIDALLARQHGAWTAVSAVMAAVPLAVVSTDVAGSVLEANPSAGDLLGVPAGRLAHKPVQVFVAADHRRAVRSLVSEALRSGRASGRVELAPRGAARQPVDVVITSTGTGAGPAAASVGGQLVWVLVPPSAGAGGAATLSAVAELCTLPSAGLDDRALLGRIAALATRALAGANWSSVTLGDPADPASTASDSAEAQELDGAQWRVEQGPCRQAWLEGVPVLSDDLAHDPRWPALARLAADTPVTSCLGVPVPADRASSRPAGVLNIYSARRGALGGPASVEVATVFSVAAGAVLAEARRTAELLATATTLREAVDSRVSIDQCTGLVAGWLQCGLEEASAVLAAMSRGRDIRLRDLAALLVADHPARDDLRPLLVAQQEELRRGRLSA